MKDHIIIHGIIDYEGDIACAALTEQEADSIIEDLESGGGGFHKDTIYLYGDGILEEGLLREAKNDEEAKQEAIKSVLSELRKWVAAFESAC